MYTCRAKLEQQVRSELSESRTLGFSKTSEEGNWLQWTDTEAVLSVQSGLETEQKQGEGEEEINPEKQALVVNHWLLNCFGQLCTLQVSELLACFYFPSGILTWGFHKVIAIENLLTSTDILSLQYVICHSLPCVIFYWWKNPFHSVGSVSSLRMGYICFPLTLDILSLGM